MKISVQIILFTIGKDDQEMRLFFKPPLRPLYLLSTIITVRYYLADMGVAPHTLLHDVHFREVWDNMDFMGAPLAGSELEGFVPLVFWKGKEKGLLQILGERKGVIWMLQIPSSSLISRCHNQSFFKKTTKNTWNHDCDVTVNPKIFVVTLCCQPAAFFLF